MNVRRIHNKIETVLSLDAARTELPANAWFYQVENLTFSPWDTLLLPYLWGLQQTLGEGIAVHTGAQWHGDAGIPEDIARQASTVRTHIYAEIMGVPALSSDDFDAAPDYGLLASNGRFRRSVNRISNSSLGCCAHPVGGRDECCDSLFCDQAGKASC